MTKAGKDVKEREINDCGVFSSDINEILESV